MDCGRFLVLKSCSKSQSFHGFVLFVACCLFCFALPFDFSIYLSVVSSACPETGKFHQ